MEKRNNQQISEQTFYYWFTLYPWRNACTTFARSSRIVKKIKRNNISVIATNWIMITVVSSHFFLFLFQYSIHSAVWTGWSEQQPQVGRWQILSPYWIYIYIPQKFHRIRNTNRIAKQFSNQVCCLARFPLFFGYSSRAFMECMAARLCMNLTPIVRSLDYYHLFTHERLKWSRNVVHSNNRQCVRRLSEVNSSFIFIFAKFHN